MTLQQHFNLITEGKGNKAQFLKQARLLFPEYFNQYTDFDTATNVLKSKQIISEAAGGVVAKGFSVYDWKKILGEEVKATEKETSKEVKDKQEHAFQPSDMKNADNINFNEIMKGFFAEMYDEKNKEKTGDEIKAMVVKNLAKDPLYYTKNGNFSTMGVGYTTEAPGLGEPKEPKGKFKSSGYGDLKENKEKRKLSLKLVDGKDKKGLALYKNTEDQDDLYYYDGKVLYSVVDGDKKGPSVRMSLFNIIGLQEYSVYQGDVSKMKPESTPKDGEVYLKDLKAGDKFSIGKLEYIVVKPETNNSGVEVTYADGTGNMSFRGLAVVKLQENMSEEEYEDKLAKTIAKYVKDPDDIDREMSNYYTDGYQGFSDALQANLGRDMDFQTLVQKMHDEETFRREQGLEEQKLRSLIRNLIKEELNEGSIEINGKTVKTYTQNGDKSYNVTYDDGTKDKIAVSNDAWDKINLLHQNATKN